MHRAERILITGGSGLVGRSLTQLLQESGYEVAWLSRQHGKTPVKRFLWEPGRGECDQDALPWADHVIHLAGAGIADKPLTPARVRELYRSRVATAKILVNGLTRPDVTISTFLSTSATGYYGSGGDSWQYEQDPPGDELLGDLCVAWEAAVQPVAKQDTRLAILRTGLVLSDQGGFLQQFRRSLKFGIMPYFGNGNNYFSWIHINDLCRAFLYVIQQRDISGTYNCVAPNPIQSRAFASGVIRAAGRSAISLPVPYFLMKGLLGKRGILPFYSNRVANEKLLATGFSFQFTTAQQAVAAIDNK